ncbi:MAG: aminoacyl-tRNA hydrolase [Candidatus Paceibacterota bacterium]|jgi:PTH1 family peptidyl-tRNA hydrolase
MFIIAGLGNPGQNLENTRHNVGFRTLDVLASRNALAVFSSSKKYQSMTVETLLDQEKVLLLKPQTFMNASGLAVKAAMKNFKLGPENLIIVHDDADLPLGSVKISKNHGPGGHKGVASIIQEIKNQNFTRIRVGIAPANPPAEGVKPDLKNFVLKNFTKEEEAVLAKTLIGAADAVKTIMFEGTDAAMNKYN